MIPITPLLQQPILMQRSLIVMPTPQDIIAGSINLSRKASNPDALLKLQCRAHRRFIKERLEWQRNKNLYKSYILLVKINSPPNLVRDKGIYSTRAGSMLTSAGPAWDLRVQPYGTRR
jgi:hypothetical protein